MRRVPPSRVAREQIQQLMTTGIPEGTNILSQLALLGVQYLGQLGMEQEQADLLAESITSAPRANRPATETGMRTSPSDRSASGFPR
jgi:hypothetical protein